MRRKSFYVLAGVSLLLSILWAVSYGTPLGISFLAPGDLAHAVSVRAVHGRVAFEVSDAPAATSWRFALGASRFSHGDPLLSPPRSVIQWVGFHYADLSSSVQRTPGQWTSGRSRELVFPLWLPVLLTAVPVVLAVRARVIARRREATPAAA